MEQAGRGLLEGLRAQSQTVSHTAVLSSEDMVSSVAAHQMDNKSHRESATQGAFTSTGKLKTTAARWAKEPGVPDD